MYSSTICCTCSPVVGFWCRGYYVDTVGKNTKAIDEYIKNQLEEDKQYEQLTMKEMIALFTGEPVKNGK